MELTPEQRARLTAALSTQRAAVEQRLVAYSAAAWRSLGDWRDDDIDRFVEATLPRIEAGQLTIANLTDAYVAHMTDGEPSTQLVDPRELRAGVAHADVYRRPAGAMRSALASGASMSDAIESGAKRLANLVSTDMELAHTHQARASMLAANKAAGRRRGRGRVNAYARTLQGEDNCALCAIASTQRYWVGDLLPMHPGCNCGVRPLGVGEHLEQVIDRELLEATHAQVEGLTGEYDRSGRLVDYRQLIVTREHGEVGPTLTWKHQRFTGKAGVEPTPAAPEPEPAPAPKTYPVPGGFYGETTETPPVDWLSSSFTRRELADFDHADLVDILNEAREVNDPTAWEWVTAELTKRERQEAGHRGTGYTHTELRKQFDEHVDREYWAAEGVTNGFLLNEAGRRAGIDPKSLFRPNPKESPERAEARAMRYASDELKWYWSSNPRLTFDAFVGGADELARVGTVDF